MNRSLSRIGFRVLGHSLSIAAESLHSDIQQIIGKTPDKQGLQILNHRVSDLIGAEVRGQFVQRHLLIDNLSSLLVARSVALFTRWVPNTLDALHLVPLAVVCQVDLFPQGLAPGFAGVDGLAAAVEEDVDAVMLVEFFLQTL